MNKNSTFLSFDWRDALISGLVAVIFVLGNILLPALKDSAAGNPFIMNWVALGYNAIYTFLSTLFGLFFVNSQGQIFTTETGKVLGITKTDTTIQN